MDAIGPNGVLLSEPKLSVLTVGNPIPN